MRSKLHDALTALDDAANTTGARYAHITPALARYIAAKLRAAGDMEQALSDIRYACGFINAEKEITRLAHEALEAWRCMEDDPLQTVTDVSQELGLYNEEEDV